MYYSYKSSSKTSSRTSSNFSSIIQNKNKYVRNSIDNDLYGVMNYDLKINFVQKKPAQYESVKVYEENDVQKLQKIKKKAEDKIKLIKQGNNCKITQTQGIQYQDSQKLMNFVIGGYVDNDFNQYLSIKQFNQKKQDFQVLNQIYNTSLSLYNNRPKIVKRQSQDSTNSYDSFQQRSLLSVIYLNQNLNKQTRNKIEDFMKKNKILW